MEEIEVSKKSKLIEWIDTKTDLIMKFLDVFFEDDKVKSKLSSMNFHPIFVKQLATNNDYTNMSERTFDEPEEVMHCLDQYQNIMAKINCEVPFIPSIENFCMFMGWTAKIYNRTLSESGEDIKDVMNMINDYIIESQFSAGQGGFAKANLTKFKLQGAGEHGHGVVTQKEQNDENRANKDIKTKQQYEKELASMGFKTIK